jgi:hypothetical protein
MLADNVSPVLIGVFYPCYFGWCFILKAFMRPEIVIVD